MKARILYPLALLAFLVVALTLTYCSTDDSENKESSELESVQDTIPPDQLCDVTPSWFPHNQTPPPEEGDRSPFDASSTNNRIFHQWSWQKFLWLTKPESDGTPQFLNSRIAIQVSSLMIPITIPVGTKVVLTDTEQAGFKRSILQTNPSYAQGNDEVLASQVVYYSIHTNPMMYTSAMQFKERMMRDSSFRSNNASFPVGSFELKISWVDVRAIPASKLGNYYTTTASLSKDNGRTFQNTQVAMLGMHIVGIVKNHPEFIWATFEHDDLAPNYDWKTNTVSSNVDKLLFKVGRTTGINGIDYDTTTKLGIEPYRVFDLFQYGVPRNPGGGFMATSQSEGTNFNNVQGINQCVKSKLKDVWNNYFYNGSIWLNTDKKDHAAQIQLILDLGKTGKTGSATPGSFARGSLNCANVTMETFTQTFNSNISQINVNNLANCFSCHTAQYQENQGPKYLSALYMSHIYRGLMGVASGLTLDQINKRKTEGERRLFYQK